MANDNKNGEGNSYECICYKPIFEVKNVNELITITIFINNYST